MCDFVTVGGDPVDPVAICFCHFFCPLFRPRSGIVRRTTSVLILTYQNVPHISGQGGFGVYCFIAGIYDRCLVFEDYWNITAPVRLSFAMNLLFGTTARKEASSTAVRPGGSCGRWAGSKELVFADRNDHQKCSFRREMLSTVQAKERRPRNSCLCHG